MEEAGRSTHHAQPTMQRRTNQNQYAQELVISFPYDFLLRPMQNGLTCGDGGGGGHYPPLTMAFSIPHEWRFRNLREPQQSPLPHS